MTALIFALGLLPLSDNDFDTTHYVPVKTYSFPANSQALEEAKKRAELITLLAESIELSAHHKNNQPTEERIQRLLRSLLRKEKHATH